MTLTKIQSNGISTPLTIFNNEKIKFGVDGDLEITSDGTNGIVRQTDNSGGLYIQADNFVQIGKVGATTPVYAKFVKDGAVTLYHNNVPKLETTANAVNVKNSANTWSTISRDANGYFGWSWSQGNNFYGYLGVSGGGSEIGQYVSGGNHFVLRTEDHFSLYYGYNTRLLTTDTNGYVGLYAGGVEKLTTNNNGVKITNTQSGFTSGALKINTDLANYGHIIVRDKNQTQTAALCIENESDASDANCHVYRTVDLASSAWANARAAALSHNFQITTDTPNSNVKLRVDSYGIKAVGASNGNTQSTGIRVNTDILNYGVVSARDAHGEGSTNGSNHIACFQAENPGSGSDEVNIVTRSVNLNSAAWARGRYVASAHEFAIGGNSSSNDVTATVTSNGIKLAANCGINFSAYATSGNPSSNLLDDYEEGSFTPRLGGNSNSSTYYVEGTGTYIKIGRMVCVSVRFSNVDLDNNSSGDAKVHNMPFTTGHSPSGGVVAVTNNVQYYNVPFSNDYISNWYISGNTTSWNGLVSRTNTTWAAFPASDFHASNLYLNFFGTYFTDA